MKLFTKHPKSIGESYTEHFAMATSFAIPLILAGFACFMHGLFPFLFEKTGSNIIRKLYDRMVSSRVKMKSDDPSVNEWVWCI